MTEMPATKGPPDGSASPLGEELTPPERPASAPEPASGTAREPGAGSEQRAGSARETVLVGDPERPEPGKTGEVGETGRAGPPEAARQPAEAPEAAVRGGSDEVSGELATERRAAVEDESESESESESEEASTGTGTETDTGPGEDAGRVNAVDQADEGAVPAAGDHPTSAARSTPPEGPLLWASDLRYAHRGSPALLGVSLELREGEIVSVTGARGSGKTTLLRCLAGHLVPQSGEVWFDGVPVHTLPTAARERLRRDRLGWIGSEPQLVPELTAWENAALPLLLRGTRHRVARGIAREWLERLEVEECAECRPADLVQSQRQRIALARALVHSPALLFADEPTVPLHQSDRSQLLRTLTAAARSHRITVVLATHRPAESAAEVRAGAVSTDRVITLHDGRRIDGDAVPQTEDSAACSLSV